ncbi:MAG: DUF1343 domain-containing protein [Cellulomonadaceae bacterium]|jgi:uncharacterized protein YbbC (DUF1343 family)|nr:DUF1343 domain-containing protein [Cellulomonadaceae bacterium]
MAKVALGIDRLDRYLPMFEGKRVGLITNPTGTDSALRSTIDILDEHTNLVALFSPEHGVRGDIEAGQKVSDYVDERTSIPVYTLYGDSKKPTAKMLAGLDILAIDIQDVGSRFYTYLYTMAYCMQACAELGKEFVVFDRPNPVGGITVDGNVVEPGFTSFVGLYPIPQRYGLTFGEIAALFNNEFAIGCNLTVIPMEGWTRDMYWRDTGLPWVAPSPNMPTPETAIGYNATCLFEGTNVSEGRGTTKPFEFVGAPWLDAGKLADTMNGLELAGAHFRPVYFTPTFSKHAGVLCQGIQLHVLDKDKFQPSQTALHLLHEVKKQNPAEFEFLPAFSAKGKPFIDYLNGCDQLRTTSFDPEAVAAAWQKEAAQFGELKKKYEIY